MNIVDKIKSNGVLSVVVGYSVELDKIHDRLDVIELRQETIELNLAKIELMVQSIQDNIYLAANELIDKRIRSTEGLKLVEFQTQDVHTINKHIERLERKIEELKSEPDNPYSHLFK